jgi:hypothetical protein
MWRMVGKSFLEKSFPMSARFPVSATFAPILLAFFPRKFFIVEGLVLSFPWASHP